MKNALPFFILTGRTYCLSFYHQLAPLKLVKSKYVNSNCHNVAECLLKFSETNKLCLVYATTEIKHTFYRIQLCVDQMTDDCRR